LTEFAVVGGGISRQAPAGDKLSASSFRHSVPQGTP